MNVVVKKWGNSASVRIPSSLMKAANLSLDQLVDIREENGRLVIEPIPEAIDIDAIDIDGMIEAITEENRHPETDWGAPAGAEFW